MRESAPIDIFGDFFSQLPTGLFVLVCSSIFLLFLAFAWFIYFKPKRANEKLKHTNALHNTMPNTMPISMTDTGEMPDLDALLNLSDPIRDQNAPQSIQLHTGETITAAEVVAILRDPRDGRLVVQMSNVGYRTLADTPDAKRDFTRIMRELASIIEPDSTTPAPAASPPPAQAALPAQPPPAPPAPSPTQPAPTSPGLPPLDNKGTLPGDLPTFDLDESVSLKERGGLFGRPKYEAAPVPEVNIAASIEAYLQYKLKHTPAYNTRQIHVHSAPGGGVRIQVDSAYYKAVGDVVDEDVREFLANTIQEWQDRQ